MNEGTNLMLHPIGLMYELWEGFKILDPLFNYPLKLACEKNKIITDKVREEIKKHRDTIN